jgi:hypothetical protein
MTKEQDEKNEKEVAKHEEKQEEKWTRDPLSGLIWALVLIWAGVVFLAENLGWLDDFGNIFGREPSELPFEIPFVPLEAWTLFFLGLGLLLVFEVLVRLLVPAYRRPVIGTTIMAVVFLGLAVGNWELVWPLALIGLGLVLIISNFLRGR